MKDSKVTSSRILLVEDEESLALGLEFNLNEDGYVVDWVRDGREGINNYDKNQYDLIILDIMLPFYDGFEVAAHIRKTSPRVPILMLTARKDTADKVKGLELGVDDYMTKPFHLQELLLRIKGMLKRKEWYTQTTVAIPSFQIADVKVDFESLTCSRGEEKINLTSQEAMLLQYLIQNRDRIVTRKELLENVWHVNPDVETRTVDIFIARLRKYIESDAAFPRFIKSVRGKGYLFSDKTDE